jgi:hypothetical protein
MWTNVKNGKRYIGSHIGTPDDGYLGSGILFKQALKKHGKKGFIRTILYEEHVSEKNLREKEVEIINEYNACEDESFYNLREHAAYEKSSHKRSEETKKKISKLRKEYYSDHKNRETHSQLMKEKWKDEDYRKKRKETTDSDEYKSVMREKNLGEKNPMYGKICSEERKKYLSEKYTGKGNPFYGKKHKKETIEDLRKKIKPKFGKENPSSVTIKVYGVVYDTIKSAMKATGLSYKKINKIGERENESIK